MIRTEEEILKDFEKLGYEVKKTSTYIDLVYENDSSIIITIWLSDMTYALSSSFLDMQEHKLLNELFKCYSWI